MENRQEKNPNQLKIVDWSKRLTKLRIAKNRYRFWGCPKGSPEAKSRDTGPVK